MRTAMLTALLSMFGIGCVGQIDPAKAPKVDTIYEFKMKDIDGKEVDLAKYKNKVLLVVNTASNCGLTPQYKSLEALYDKYKDKGLVVLGFPANNFMGQEPGTNEEIKNFCSTKYDITFPMFSKISVKGDDIEPLYRWLIAQSGRNDEIEWNFAKFLVGKDGKVIARFEPKLAPDDKKVVEAIEAALKG
ncbi:MAG: glutathione peroxidase [Armatimonadetes bacterium]|nr:glutathione peroxidase [Armatimonadota bacterium]